MIENALTGDASKAKMRSGQGAVTIPKHSPTGETQQSEFPMQISSGIGNIGDLKAEDQAAAHANVVLRYDDLTPEQIFNRIMAQEVEEGRSQQRETKPVQPGPERSRSPPRDFTSEGSQEDTEAGVEKRGWRHSG